MWRTLRELVETLSKLHVRAAAFMRERVKVESLIGRESCEANDPRQFLRDFMTSNHFSYLKPIALFSTNSLLLTAHTPLTPLRILSSFTGVDRSVRVHGKSVAVEVSEVLDFLKMLILKASFEGRKVKG